MVDEETRLDRLLTWFKNNKVFSVVMLAGVAIVGISQLVSSITSLVETGEQFTASKQPLTTPPPQPVAQPPSLATELLRFGAAGTGPGYLENPAWIVTSQAGQIVIGERVDRGRIQRFDPDGHFLGQWFAKDRNNGSASLGGIAPDLPGDTLYVSQVWDVYRYDLNTGNDLGKIARPERNPGESRDADVGIQVEATASDPRGGVVALWTSPLRRTPDLVRYEHGTGTPHLVRTDVFAGHLQQTGNTDWEVAVNGSGELLVLATAENAVFKLSAQGEFLDRFGDAGDGPGQWSDPDHLAVDGAGHIVVSAFNGIHVLDASGHYLGKFSSNCTHTPVAAVGLTFDSSGDLYLLCDDAIIKYRLKLP